MKILESAGWEHGGEPSRKTDYTHSHTEKEEVKKKTIDGI